MGKELGFYNHFVHVHKYRWMDTQILGGMDGVIKDHRMIKLRESHFPRFGAAARLPSQPRICFLISLNEAKMKIDCPSGAMRAVVFFFVCLGYKKFSTAPSPRVKLE